MKKRTTTTYELTVEEILKAAGLDKALNGKLVIPGYSRMTCFGSNAVFQFTEQSGDELTSRHSEPTLSPGEHLTAFAEHAAKMSKVKSIRARDGVTITEPSTDTQ